MYSQSVSAFRLHILHHDSRFSCAHHIHTLLSIASVPLDTDHHFTLSLNRLFFIVFILIVFILILLILLILPHYSHHSSFFSSSSSSLSSLVLLRSRVHRARADRTHRTHRRLCAHLADREGTRHHRDARRRPRGADVRRRNQRCRCGSWGGGRWGGMLVVVSTVLYWFPSCTRTSRARMALFCCVESANQFLMSAAMVRVTTCPDLPFSLSHCFVE
jgi:hypothetical protein